MPENKMIHIPAPDGKRLVWYLAMEEYIGRHTGDYPNGVFFTWSVNPTVIFGRHQVMADEVDIGFCRTNGIQTYRRKSGGGCVYADRGNLMLSYIVPSTHAEQVFQQYLDDVATLLNELGLPAVKSEHNDILVEGQKVSGNACYALKTGTIVHGTMLYDVNFEQLQRAITPPPGKLAKHGIQSVRQRVRNLKPLLINNTTCHIESVEALAKVLYQGLCDHTSILSDEALREIDSIEAGYLRPEFINGKESGD